MDETMSASQALAAAAASRAKMASAADCPPARHLVFAVLFGGVVAVQAAPHPWNLVGDAVLLLGAGATALVDRARKGVFVNGYRAGRTRAIALGLLAVMMPVFLVTFWLRVERGMVWAPLAGGALVAAIAYFASRSWSRVYRAELEGKL